MRQKLSQEIETREAVTKAINANVQTSRLVYPSPSVMAKILKADGINVSKQTLYTAYAQLGIVLSDQGVWVKEL